MIDCVAWMFVLDASLDMQKKTTGMGTRGAAGSRRSCRSGDASTTGSCDFAVAGVLEKRDAWAKLRNQCYGCFAAVGKFHWSSVRSVFDLLDPGEHENGTFDVFWRFFTGLYRSWLFFQL